jgi:hypothetical protein
MLEINLNDYGKGSVSMPGHDVGSGNNDSNSPFFICPGIIVQYFSTGIPGNGRFDLTLIKMAKECPLYQFDNSVVSLFVLPKTSRAGRNIQPGRLEDPGGTQPEKQPRETSSSATN